MINRLATVKSTSAQIGVQAVAMKAHVQYDHSGLTMAMSRGDTAVIDADTRTRISALTRFTSQPVRKFVAAPVITIGRKRIEV